MADFTKKYNASYYVNNANPALEASRLNYQESYMLELDERTKYLFANCVDKTTFKGLYDLTYSAIYTLEHAATDMSEQVEQASASASSANAAATNAANSAKAAAGSEARAKSDASDAMQAANSAEASALSASESATNAANSASSAKNSEQNTTISAGKAAESAQTAEVHATSAESSRLGCDSALGASQEVLQNVFAIADEIEKKMGLPNLYVRDGGLFYEDSEVYSFRFENGGLYVEVVA